MILAPHLPILQLESHSAHDNLLQPLQPAGMHIYASTAVNLSVSRKPDATSDTATQHHFHHKMWVMWAAVSLPARTGQLQGINGRTTVGDKSAKQHQRQAALSDADEQSTWKPPAVDQVVHTLLQLQQMVRAFAM